MLSCLLALLVAAPLDGRLAQQPPGLVGKPPPRGGARAASSISCSARVRCARRPSSSQRSRQSQPLRPRPRSRAAAGRRRRGEPKDENARKILVVGDFVAGGLAWGLDQTFADEPKIAVIDKSNNASGLVRDDYYDWNKPLPAILNEVKPDVVVVVLGANDRQQIRAGKDRLRRASDAWEKAYTAASPAWSTRSRCSAGRSSG